MHGRIKVKTTAEQDEQKRQEREKKLKLFRKASTLALNKIEKKEFDVAGLEVTKQILSANSDYSSMWNYRRDAFKHYMDDRPENEMKKIFDEELEFLASCLRNNPKSYGCWQHRCFVMQTRGDPDWKKELSLCNQFLQFDDRNFHCWDYRRFVVKNSGSAVSLDDEIQCTDKLVQTNFSNYSSWHYRSKLLPLRYPSPDSSDQIEESKLLEELELVQNAFFTDPNDQSAWFYHRWLLGRGGSAAVLIAAHGKKSPMTISCVFKRPINHSEVETNMSVFLDDIKQGGTWHSTMESDYQHLWTFKLKQDNHEGKKVTLKYKKQTVDLKFNAENPEAVFKCDVSHEFQEYLSSAKLELLQSELESCIQLNDLEPGNKWALLTLVLLMHAIDPLAHKSDIAKYINELKSVDPMRKEYYNDLSSRFIIEDCITGLQNSNAIADLGNMGLSRICHLQYFSTISKLDISKNSIKNLSGPFYLLQCCEVLLADNNHIEDVSGIRCMPKLTRLSLTENCIELTDGLKGLTSCPNLLELNLQHNKLNTEDLLFVIKMLSNVKIEF